MIIIFWKKVKFEAFISHLSDTFSHRRRLAYTILSTIVFSREKVSTFHQSTVERMAYFSLPLEGKVSTRGSEASEAVDG